MRIKIDTKLLDNAIRRTYNLKYVAPVEEYIKLIWNEYDVLVLKQKEDRKAFNGQKLMNIPGVRGFVWEKNKVTIRTDKGYKTYKVGRFTMDSIAKRVRTYLT